MSDLETFQLLRPLWLLGLIPIGIAVALLWRHPAGRSQWQSVIDKALLVHLLEGHEENTKKWWLILLLIAWLAALLALTGPVWKKIPQPVEIRKDALIVALDLSLSMNAQDILPSRLERAKFKLIDLFERRKEGQTALIVYAGEPHVVVPFTDDINTLRNFLPSLLPDIMPSPGSRADLALYTANELFSDNQITKGRILLVTDGIEEPDKFRNAFLSADHELAVLGIGSKVAGAPIPDPRGATFGFLKNRSGNPVIVTLAEDRIRQLTQSLGGLYSSLTLDETDLDLLLPDFWWESEVAQSTERQYDQFLEQGYWLIFLCLPALLGLFRKGTMTMLAAFTILSFMPVFSEQALASSNAPETVRTNSLSKENAESSGFLREIWNTLWQSPDQKGYELLQQNKPEEALKHFQLPEWRASAHYKDGNYEEAESIWSVDDSAISDYNRGNALARQGNFEAALKAYESALSKQADLADAESNKELMQKLLAEQQQGKSDEQKSGDEEDGEQQQASGGEGEQQSADAEEEQQQASSGEEEGEEEGEQQQRSSGEEGEQDQNGDEQSVAQDQSEENNEMSEQDANALSEAEKKQSLQQWLRRIPDDPGGLLRRKFKHEAQQKPARGRSQKSGTAW